MKINTIYSFWGTLLTILLLLISWSTCIIAFYIDFSNSMAIELYLGGVIVIAINVLITYVLIKGVLKHTFTKITADDVCIIYKRFNHTQILPWAKVVAVFSSRVPAYLYGKTNGYSIQYINDGLLDTVYLIKSKKISDFLLYLTKQSIIDLNIE